MLRIAYVLEQRIGRARRLGQALGGQVINFVAQGSIEEGMLSVLAFKKSFFAGVLDGGESEIFLNGTRLSKFMESVDRVTGAMGHPEAAQEGPQVRAQQAAPSHTAGLDDGGVASRVEVSVASAGDDAAIAKPVETEALAELDAGAGAALTHLASSPAATSTSNSTPDPWGSVLDAGLKLIQTLAAAPAGAMPAWIETDAVTGRSFVKLPMPEAAPLVASLASLVAALRPAAPPRQEGS